MCKLGCRGKVSRYQSSPPEHTEEVCIISRGSILCAAGSVFCEFVCCDRITLVDRQQDCAVLTSPNGIIYLTPQGALLATGVPRSALGRRTTLHCLPSRRTRPDNIGKDYASSPRTCPECMYSWTSTLGERMLEKWV